MASQALTNLNPWLAPRHLLWQTLSSTFASLGCQVGIYICQALRELRHSHPGGQGSWEVHIDLAILQCFLLGGFKTPGPLGQTLDTFVFEEIT